MKRAQAVIKAVAIALLQFALANVATLLLSFPVNMQPEENPWGVATVLTVTSLIGITLGGWLGLRIKWLPSAPRYLIRTAGAAIGIVVLLGLALGLGQMREASPLLTGSMFAGIVGFHATGWLSRSTLEAVAQQHS